PVIGRRLPTDHAYALYSAISRLLPRLHGGEVPFGLAPVTGEYVGDGQMLLDPQRSTPRPRRRRSRDVRSPRPATRASGGVSVDRFLLDQQRGPLVPARPRSREVDARQRHGADGQREDQPRRQAALAD